MKDYDNKEAAERNVMRDMRAGFSNLHPIDKADAYIEVGRLATETGEYLQKINEELGVPEKAAECEAP